MQRLEHVLKEAIETVTRGVLRAVRGRGEEDIRALLGQLAERGCARIDNFWSADRCAAAAAAIDAGLDVDARGSRRWTDAEHCDMRLYLGERLDGEPRAYFEDPFVHELRRRYTGFTGGDSLLLAARMRYVAGNKGSGGGWHRDSPHRSQFKALLYLTDVTAASGPFEFVVGSHTAGNSVSMLLSGHSAPNQYRFTDGEVNALATRGAEIESFHGPAGTLLLVDTKGIHRGRPIESGQRYAMTHYFWDGAMPDGFADMRTPAMQ
jgi:hypothetical protein